jgi:hypothetical protein
VICSVIEALALDQRSLTITYLGVLALATATTLTAMFVVLPLLIRRENTIKRRSTAHEKP